MRWSTLALCALCGVLGIGCASMERPAPAATVGTKSEGLTKTATITLWPLEELAKVNIDDVPLCSDSSPNTRSCKLQIKVTNMQVDGVPSCVIEFARPADDLVTLGDVPSGMTIYWQIMPVTGSDPYVFTRSDGVAFAGNDGKRRAFVNGQRVDDNPKVFQWDKRNRGRHVYTYVVNARSQSGSRECSLDPWVRNTF